MNAYSSSDGVRRQKRDRLGRRKASISKPLEDLGYRVGGFRDSQIRCRCLWRWATEHEF